MTKEQENRSVEEYFEKVRNGEVQVLVEKEGESQNDSAPQESSEEDQRLVRMLVEIHEDETTLQELEKNVSIMRQRIDDKKVVVSIYIEHTDPKTRGEQHNSVSGP